MKFIYKILYITILLFVPCVIKAQDNADKPQVIYKMPKNGNFLRYLVSENGDTIYIANITPSYKYAWAKKKDMKKYYRLVYNFAKVYPYALVAKRLVHETDSTFNIGNLSRRKKEKYVNSLQNRIIFSYQKTARSLTISQGQLLMKLIDREIGLSSYDIIRNYKNRIAAGFWQGIAKMFGTDMKKHYDPYGDDRDTEDLVRKWENGEFPDFYFSIFGKYPVIPETPENLR